MWKGLMKMEMGRGMWVLNEIDSVRIPNKESVQLKE